MDFGLSEDLVALQDVARRFADKPALADLLVGVTGDFVPAAQVLKPSYVWQLVV